MLTPSCPPWAVSIMSSRTSPIVSGVARPRAMCRFVDGSASIARTGPRLRWTRFWVISAAMVVLPVPPFPASAITFVITYLHLYRRRTIDGRRRETGDGRRAYVSRRLLPGLRSSVFGLDRRPSSIVYRHIFLPAILLRPYLRHAGEAGDLGVWKEERGGEAIIERVVGGQLKISHATGDLRQLTAGLARKQAHVGALDGRIAQEHETIPGEVRQQSDLNGLLDVDVLAEGSPDQDALDTAQVDPNAVGQDTEPSENGRLGPHQIADVDLG